MDATRQVLVDLEDLPDRAVLSVRGGRSCVLENQAVLVDPLVGGFQRGDEFLRADDEADVGGSPAIGRELSRTVRRR